MYKNSFVHYVSKICVDVLFIVGIICCLFVPFSKPLLVYYFNLQDNLILPMILVLIASGIASVYILWQLRVMFKTLIGGNPFVLKNVTCLRKMAVASMLISIIFCIKSLFWFTISTLVIILIFVIACMFCLTLKDLFKQAVYYKDENDLTV
jgi:hypothetical protein